MTKQTIFKLFRPSPEHQTVIIIINKACKIMSGHYTYQTDLCFSGSQSMFFHPEGEQDVFLKMGKI